ncbi:MAG: guanylate cyclase [Spirochaetia bacterium]|nr:guanylate cyclase [Spirochaetia bacterium]
MIQGFPDKKQEADFVKFHDEDTATLARVAIILSLLSWTIFAGLSFFLFPGAAVRVTLTILCILYPVFLVQIIATFVRRLYGNLQIFSFFANAVAGLVSVYVGHSTLQHPFLSVFALSLICIFAFLLLRLRFAIGSLSTLLFLIPYQILLLNSTAYSSQDKAISTFALWTAELFAVAGGYSLERMSRDLFLKTRIIEDQSRKLALEREKSDRLLFNMMPVPIAERLKEGEMTIADSHSAVTILFADIVGFTALAARISPVEVVRVLNGIFSTFDALVQACGAEKIKTIGDAYMAATGIPDKRVDHVQTIAGLALQMISAIRNLDKAGGSLDIRIGIHTGSVVAGVIGTQKFLYDIWGDTVNTASRMESHGIPGEIQVSEEVYVELKQDFDLLERGTIAIKGKGDLKTYILKGRKQKG